MRNVKISFASYLKSEIKKLENDSSKIKKENGLSNEIFTKEKLYSKLSP